MEERAAARGGGNRAQNKVNLSPMRTRVRSRRSLLSGSSGSTGAPLSDLSAFDYAGPDAGRRPVAGSSSSITAGPGGVISAFPFRSGMPRLSDVEASGVIAKVPENNAASVSSAVVPTIMAPRADSAANRLNRARRNRRPVPAPSRKQSTGSLSTTSFGSSAGSSTNSNSDAPLPTASFHATFNNNAAAVGRSNADKDSQNIRFPRQETYRRKKAAAIERRDGMINEDNTPFSPVGSSTIGKRRGSAGRGGVTGNYEDDDTASIGSNSVRSYESNHSSSERRKGNSNVPSSDANGEGRPFDPFAISEDGGGDATRKDNANVWENTPPMSKFGDSPDISTSHKSTASSEIVQTADSKDTDVARKGSTDESAGGEKLQQFGHYTALPHGGSHGTIENVATATTFNSYDETEQAIDLSKQETLPSTHVASDRINPSRLFVSIALNEDLSCSYKQSKISSCSIEGIVQVQVSADSDSEVPFYLLVRDPSRHIRAIQENQKYTKDSSDELQLNDRADYKFNLTIPNADKYFPIMRYKCSSELRPVPIRVQTRVRLHGGCCRVALQISSNPANEDDLTDLTIIMAVPTGIRGETLSTSPPGGVWNDAKRSVLWCVAELGDGEKFQLQAQFEMENGEETLFGPDQSAKPSFPVLVRCQCMYAQLSDVEFEVSDAPETPAEVTTKIARRFRLSHREKS